MGRSKLLLANGRQLGIGVEKRNVPVVEDFNNPDIDWDNLSLSSNHIGCKTMNNFKPSLG